MTKYHYTESGLKNVFIEGIVPVIDEEGDEVIEIRFIAALHAEIARGIITQKGTISGEELRFLRTEMGFTQAELASHVSLDAQTIGRWERSEKPVNPTAETVIRALAGEKLVHSFNKSIEELAESIKATEEDDEINIQAQEEGYRLLAA
jgi:transcriptional regulator with XRE-family HTH domain